MKHVVMLLMIGLLIPASVGATFKDCIGAQVHQAGDSEFVIDHLPEVSDLPLPEDFVAFAKKHPIYAWARKFRINHLDVNDGHNFDLESGEGIQAKFVFQVLQSLVPNLRYVESKYESKRDGRPLFVITPDDSAESRGVDKDVLPKFSRLNNSIDMPIIKPANATSASLDHSQMRATFGIPDTAKVASVYSSDFPGVAVLSELNRHFGASVIFYSHNFDKAPQLLMAKHVSWAVENGYKILFLGELRQTSLAPGQKYLILNDTRGRMPFIHAAADLAVVQGPINMFESLNVGTPTIAYNSPQLMNRGNFSYRPEVYQDMLGVALASGGARFAGSPEEFVTAIQQMRGASRQFTRPYLVQRSDGKTPVERFLDHLMDVMKEQGL